MPSEVRFSVVQKMLEEAGWSLARINGSHHIFVKPGQRSLPIPVHQGKVAPIYVSQAKKIIGEGGQAR